jgi:hypothetical protein
MHFKSPGKFNANFPFYHFICLNKSWGSSHWGKNSYCIRHGYDTICTAKWVPNFGINYFADIMVEYVDIIHRRDYTAL